MLWISFQWLFQFFYENGIFQYQLIPAYFFEIIVNIYKHKYIFNTHIYLLLMK